MSEQVSTVIKGATLIDGTGKEPTRDSTVVVDGRRIVQVATEKTDIPQNSNIIDGSGLCIMPGLVDAHLHLSGMITDNFVQEMVIVPERQKLVRAVGQAASLLDAGYTMVRDCGGLNALAIRDAIAEGSAKGPRIVAAGYVLTQTFGHGDFYHFLPAEIADSRISGKGAALICDGVEECLKGARTALREGADFIKITSSGGVFSERDKPEDLQFTPPEIKAIVEAAKNVRKFVATHCLSAEGARISIECGVKTIEHSAGLDKEAMEMGLKHETVFVPTMSVSKRVKDYGTSMGFPKWAVEKSGGRFDKETERIHELYKIGATIASGTDFIGTNLMKMGTNASELEILVKYCGFRPIDAIVSATRNGAKACGLEGKAGTIEEGMMADILLVAGDPLNDISILQDHSRIRMVMKEGKIEVDRGIRMSKRAS